MVGDMRTREEIGDELVKLVALHVRLTSDEGQTPQKVKIGPENLHCLELQKAIIEAAYYKYGSFTLDACSRNSLIHMSQVCDWLAGSPQNSRAPSETWREFIQLMESS